jgi:hypothetical protein
LGGGDMKKDFTVHLTFNSFAGFAQLSFLDEGEDKEEITKRWNKELVLEGRSFGSPTRIIIRERK